MKVMRVIVTILTLLMALGLASIVAYVSVTGLMKLFAGAGMIGMAFFILIELSKIVSTTLLHTFKGKIKGFVRIALNLGIGIAMVITSLGIYGFLSSTYKDSFLQSENTASQIELLEKKRDGYQEQITFVVDEKTTVNQSISELTKGLSNNVIQYKDQETGQIITTTSSSTRKVLQEQLDNAIDRQSVLTNKSDSLSTLVFDIENQILEVKLSDESSAELGPLIFLSDVSGMTMDNVMKWFILLLIIIGDPLAVMMVIAFNKIVNKQEKKSEMTDDEIIKKGKDLEMQKVFEKAKEIGKQREEKYGVVEDEPTALANSQYRLELDDEEFDEDHATDMVMNQMVEEVMEEEDLQTVGDFIESLDEDKEEEPVFVSPGVSTIEYDTNETPTTEEVINEIEENSIDPLEADKAKIVNLPKETPIEVIETLKETPKEVKKDIENQVVDNQPPKKRMGIDRIR
jgi:hypothetical protein